MFGEFTQIFHFNANNSIFSDGKGSIPRKPPSLPPWLHNMMGTGVGTFDSCYWNLAENVWGPKGESKNDENHI